MHKHFKKEHFQKKIIVLCSSLILIHQLKVTWRTF